MDKYGCFMQYMFIISETIVNLEHEEYFSQIIYAFQRTFSFKEKKKHQVPITSLSLHWVIYWHKPVYIFARQGSSSSGQEKIIVIIYYYICLPLCATYCILMQLNSQ